MLELGIAAGLAGTAYNASQLGRRRPRFDNSKRAVNSLYSGFEKRIDQISPGRSTDIAVDFQAPPKDATNWEHFNHMRNNQDAYGSSTTPQQGIEQGKPGIKINPNADRVYLAHELGHLASQKTDVGHLVANLRANPKLKTALLGALLTAPGVAAALESGDDDMDSSIALAALASSPVIADEILASKNGLAIMNNAGLRASLGQRGKLAGGLLSYLAAPILAGAAGNTVGNLFDQEL